MKQNCIFAIVKQSVLILSILYYFIFQCFNLHSLTLSELFLSFSSIYLLIFHLLLGNFPVTEIYFFWIEITLIFYKIKKDMITHYTLSYDQSPLWPTFKGVVTMKLSKFEFADVDITFIYYLYVIIRLDIKSLYVLWAFRSKGNQIDQQKIGCLY